jgi:hypothetical protein
MHEKTKLLTICAIIGAAETVRLLAEIANKSGDQLPAVDSDMLAISAQLSSCYEKIKDILGLP